MKITGVRQRHCSAEIGGTFHPTWIPGYPQATHEIELFEIETDTGITGLTASPSFAGGVDYEDALSYFLLGEDPHDITGILRKLESIDLIGPRPWHIELALWDIIGKDAGKSVYELLGAQSRETVSSLHSELRLPDSHSLRSRESREIPVYASTGSVMESGERIEYIEDRIKEGYDAVKLRVTSPDHIEIVRVVREAFPELTLMVDANKGWSVRVMEHEQRWSYATALSVARELEGIGDVAWLEEPLPRHDFEGYARLREETDILIAGGEFNNGGWQLREFLDHDSLDIIQPDAALACGIKQAVETAAMARQHGVEFVPHTWTNGIGFAANLHVMTAAGSSWCEFPYEPPWTPETRDFMLSETIDHENGLIRPPDGPGLGIELADELAGI